MMLKIFQTFNMGEADIKAYITRTRGEADLWVYQTTNPARATGNGIWFMTANRTEARYKLFLSQRGMADVLIYFVPNIAQAGWQKEHSWHGRL